MPKGIPGSGPFSKTAKAASAKGRGRGRASAPVTPLEAKRRAGRHLGGQTADDGNQRSEQASSETSFDNFPQEIGGVKIEVMAIPGRGGRPMQAERYPFAELPLAQRMPDGKMLGPSFTIPKEENPDTVLAAARKRHAGKTFVSRKTPDQMATRIWREA